MEIRYSQHTEKKLFLNQSQCHEVAVRSLLATIGLQPSDEAFLKDGNVICDQYFNGHEIGLMKFLRVATDADKAVFKAIELLTANLD